MKDEIKSLQNPKIKRVIKLNERRDRNNSGLFLIEGYREIKRAADSRVHIKTLYICPALFLGSNEDALIAQIKEADAEIIPCSKQVFEKISYRDRPDGLIAIAAQMQKTLSDLIPLLAAKKNPFLVVAEAIEKPGNLGTILRSCDAAGVDGVIVCDRCTDIYNPNVVRASVGTLFTQPVVEASSSETHLWLQEKKIKIIAATPSAKQEFTEASLSGPVAMDVSRAVTAAKSPRDVVLEADFQPAASASDLEERLRSAIARDGRRQLANLWSDELPRRLVDALVARSKVPLDRRGAELSTAERRRFIEQLKQCRISLSGTRGFDKAEVTAGGVALDEVDSRDMQSKLVPNLFLAGEILDLDGFIGGYNFQAAFSTGWLAGESV